MGNTKRNYEQTIPPTPSERRRLEQDLEFWVFSQKTKPNKNGTKV